MRRVTLFEMGRMSSDVFGKLKLCTGLESPGLESGPSPGLESGHGLSTDILA